MKKLNFLLIFVFFFSFSFSQDVNDKLKNARMGLYVSPAINFIKNDSESLDSKSKLGVVYGYALEIALNETHKLESGLAISYKGGRTINNAIGERPETDYKIQYITIPIFIKMRSREMFQLNWFARIGPSIHFKIKEMVTSPEDNEVNTAIVDLSIFLGAEYSLGGKTSVEASFFFNNNITDAIADSEDMQTLFHQVGLRLGFLF